MKRSELLLATLALMLGGVGNAKAGILDITINATSVPWGVCQRRSKHELPVA